MADLSAYTADWQPGLEVTLARCQVSFTTEPHISQDLFVVILSDDDIIVTSPPNI